MTSPRSRWSLEVGKVLGISIRVHVTLFLLLFWIAFAAPIADGGLRQGIAQWVLVMAVFGCILMHELAHAVVARRFGCQTREILLLPIGGIAQVERMPQRPKEELVVALAGPAANIIIAALLGGLIASAGWPVDAEQPTLFGAIIVPLFWSNVLLAAFNLLPAFPMDGGRVLRALLAMKVGSSRATRIAVVVGKAVSAVVVVAGLAAGETMLAIIGVFVWFAAERESSMTSLASVLSNATVADAMIREPHVVDATASVDEAAERMIAEGQRELAVVEQGRVVGIVTVTDITRHLAAPQPHAAIASAMHRDVPIIAPTTRLDAALDPLERRGVIFVGDRGAIIGMLTSDQLATFAALRA